MTTMADQPPPVATDRRPAWDIVIEHVEHLRDENAYGAYGACGVVDRVLVDMRNRDTVGRERYGVPLTAGNGRDALVDAYQEILDSAVYFAAALDERGIGPASRIDEVTFADRSARWHLHCIQQLFVAQIRALIQLRALIEDRAS